MAWRIIKMKCPISGHSCNKDKTVQFVQINNNEKIEGKICTDCIANKGLNSFFGKFEAEPIEDSKKSLPVLDQNSFFDVLQKILEETFFQKPAHIDPNDNIVCTGCNLSLAQIKQMGRLGCPKCYESFKEYLKPVLQRCQNGKLEHVGKKPKNIPDFQHKNLESLKEKMAEAVRAERFEEAAVLRDAIKQICGNKVIESN